MSDAAPVVSEEHVEATVPAASDEEEEVRKEEEAGEEEEEKKEEAAGGDGYEEGDVRHVSEDLQKYVIELVDFIKKKRAGEAKNMDITTLPGIVLDMMRMARSFSALAGPQKKQAVVVAVARVIAEFAPDDTQKAADLAADVVESLFEVEQSALSGVANFAITSAKKHGCCVIS